MLERRYNYINNLAYDIMSEEIRDYEEFELLLKVMLIDYLYCTKDTNWEDFEELITNIVNNVAKAYERKDEIFAKLDEAEEDFLAELEAMEGDNFDE